MQLPAGLHFPPWNHIYGQQGTWLGWSISLMFCSGFSQALAEQVCQSSFASSLTDCTGETIWIAITWQNVTYFKQRRMRNQDKKKRGKTERSAAGVKSIPFLCCSLSPPSPLPLSCWSRHTGAQTCQWKVRERVLLFGKVFWLLLQSRTICRARHIAGLSQNSQEN